MSFENVLFFEKYNLQKREEGRQTESYAIIFTNAMFPFLTLCPPHTQTLAIFG